jgi:type IV pilus assembly protein PilP
MAMSDMKLKTNSRAKTLCYSQRTRLYSIGICCALLFGCGHDMSDLEEYAAATKAKDYGSIEPIPQVKVYQGYIYPGHDRSPFDANVIAAKPKSISADANIQIDRNRTPEYLANFPLDTLKFVGTLTQDDILWGLVKGPDGTIQRVREGNYMGQNYGEIIQISDTSIKLSEIIPDGFGGFKKHQNSVALSEPLGQ